MGDYYTGLLDFNSYKRSAIFRENLYTTFATIENASRKELNEFIRAITKAASVNGEGLLSNDITETINRRKLFLIGENFTDAQVTFGLNVLIFLGDIYQRKVLPPSVVSDNLNSNENIYEIDFVSYINAIGNIYYAINNFTQDDEVDDDEEIDLQTYLTVFELYEDDAINVEDPQELSELSEKVAAFIKANPGTSNVSNFKTTINNVIQSGFIGYRKIDVEDDKGVNGQAAKEGFEGMRKEADVPDNKKVVLRGQSNNKYAMDYNRLYEPLPVGLYGNKKKAQTIKQTISIDSRHRDNYYTTLSTNYTFDMPERQNNVIQMSIIAIEMPMTFYSISGNRGNNTMLVMSDATVNYEGTSIASLDYMGTSGETIVGFKPLRSAWRVRLSDGNYDTRSWMATKTLTEISVNDAIMLAVPGAIDENGRFCKFASPAIGDYLNSSYSEDDINDIRFKINDINGKSLFASQLTTGVVINAKKISSLRFNVDNDGNLDTDTNIQKRLGWSLGFRAAEYVMGAVAPVTTSTPISAVSEGVGFITSIRYGYLSIEEYQNNGHPPLIVAFNDHILDKKIMTRICLAPIRLGHDLTSRETGFISHRRTPREYYNAVNIDKLTIKLFDEYGRIIDLNNMDWSLTMEFTKLY